MVRVDLEANGSELSRVYVRERTERCSRLRESDRRTAVEQAKRLSGPVIHGHRRHDTRRRQLHYLDAKCIRKSAGPERAKPVQSVDLFRHRESYTDRRSTLFWDRNSHDVGMGHFCDLSALTG